MDILGNCWSTDKTEINKEEKEKEKDKMLQGIKMIEDNCKSTKNIIDIYSLRICTQTTSH